MTPADDASKPVDPYPEAGQSYVPASPDEDRAFRAAVREGLAELDAGRSIPAEAVETWVKSWDSDHELPPP